MEDRGSVLRNIVIVLGFALGIIAAFIIRANLPDGMEKFTGLIFFGTIILVGGTIGTIASKFIH